MEQKVRWYERERWPYKADRTIVENYAEYVKLVEWKMFCTLTFAWKVSDAQAEKTFAAFINRLERLLRCDVTYVRGDEKRLSGCGKPACGRHFHVLLTCLAPVTAETVEELWMSMAGNRSDGAGAQVRPYDANQNGAAYVVKDLKKVEGNWAFRKLELFHPTVTVKANKRSRRVLRRHQDRQKQFDVGNQLHGNEGKVSSDHGSSSDLLLDGHTTSATT